jgi:DNA-binding response OmpR family regulator
VTSPRTILLVDDADAVRLTFAALLEDDGHRVVEAATLAEARARLDAPLDVAILDLHLPDGLGTVLVAELRARHPGAAIVVMSGDGVEIADGGADVVVDKDRSPSEVMALAEPVLERRRAGAP